MMERRFRTIALRARPRIGRCWTASLAVVVLLGLSVVASQTPALAQDVQSLADTVERLERQLQTLERNIYRSGGTAPSGSSAAAPGSAPTPAALSQISVRIGEIEEQLRQLTGDTERAGFEVRQLSGKLEKFMTDVDFRLRSLEKGGSSVSSVRPVAPGTDGPAQAGQTPAPGTIGTLSESQLRAAGLDATTPTAAPQSGPVAVASTGAQAASDSAVALPPGTPSSQYEYAFSYLMRRDFPGAEQAFSQFVAAHPGDPLAGNAQYWLGETYYVRNDFEPAARTFAEGFQRYPDSSKAADNLLKLGLSLGALKRKQDACITFAKLSTSYPAAPSNILQRAKRERSKLGCS